jgi:hypothetical protein
VRGAAASIRILLAAHVSANGFSSLALAENFMASVPTGPSMATSLIRKSIAGLK